MTDGTVGSSSRQLATVGNSRQQTRWNTSTCAQLQCRRLRSCRYRALAELGGACAPCSPCLPASIAAAGAESCTSRCVKLASSMPPSALLSSSIRTLQLGAVQQGGGSVMRNRSTKAVEPAVGLLGLWIDCLGTRVLLQRCPGEEWQGAQIGGQDRTGHKYRVLRRGGE